MLRFKIVNLYLISNKNLLQNLAFNINNYNIGSLNLTRKILQTKNIIETIMI